MGMMIMLMTIMSTGLTMLNINWAGMRVLSTISTTPGLMSISYWWVISLSWCLPLLLEPTYTGTTLYWFPGQGLSR
jgi:hypothetical protein